MTALTSLGLFVFAVICYAIKELQAHGKLRWSGNVNGFWGDHSWTRKYVWLKDHISNTKPMFVAVPNNCYYRFFKIKYKERFPGSATIFVSVTDGYHLCQLAFKVFLIASLISYKEMVNPWVDGLIYFGIWGIVFTVVYKELSK